MYEYIFNTGDILVVGPTIYLIKITGTSNGVRQRDSYTGEGVGDLPRSHTLLTWRV